MQIGVSLDESGIQRAKKQLEELERLRRVRYEVEMNAKKAQNEIDILEEKLR